NGAGAGLHVAFDRGDRRDRGQDQRRARPRSVRALSRPHAVGRPGPAALPDARGGRGAGRLLRGPDPRRSLEPERTELLGGRRPTAQRRGHECGPDRRAAAPVLSARRAPPSAVAIAQARSTFRLVLSYDGTDYHGWQVQPGARTVQGALLEAARQRLGGDTRVTGASRTDAGVHALRQVASLTTAARVAAAGIRGALNADLPRDIRILEALEAPADFDARRGAIGKRYAFLIDNGRVANPLLSRY